MFSFSGPGKCCIIRRRRGSSPVEVGGTSWNIKRTVKIAMIFVRRAIQIGAENELEYVFCQGTQPV